MQDHSMRVISARWILPVSSAPINGAWIRLDDDKVVEIGVGSPPAGTIDLGDTAILPGLVNAHTHFEFSDCSAPIGTPGIALHDWIGQVIAARGNTTPEDKQQAMEQGLQESAQAGVRLIGDIATPPFTTTLNESAATVISFAEVLGLSLERAEHFFRAAMDHNQTHQLAGVSPHAPYSTSPNSINQCVELANQHDRPLAMHVAESPAERELLTGGGGPFADTLANMGINVSEYFPWCKAPFERLIGQLAQAPRCLVVHGNDLNSAEIQLLSRHSHLSVVYCPRTHHFFGHDQHPVDQMLNAGIRVALGTDSRASNPDLNLWREVQFLMRHRGDLDPQAVIQMATLSGADALGSKTTGRIETGCTSGLGFVPTTAKTIDQLYRDCCERDYVPLENHPKFNPT